MHFFRITGLLGVLFLMQPILLGAENPAIRRLAQLLSPTATKALGEDELKARFFVIIAHLEQTRLDEGFRAEEQLQRAVALKPLSPERAALTRAALLDAYRAAESWQLFTSGQLATLAAGEAATIQFGRFKGQLCAAAYLSNDPPFQHELGNLRLTTAGETPDAAETQRMEAALNAMHAAESERKEDAREAAKTQAGEKKAEWQAALQAAGGKTGANNLSITAQTLESTSHENRQRVKLFICATNTTHLPVETSVEWYFLARSPERGSKFLVGQGNKDLRLVPAAAETWETYSEGLTSNTAKSTALRLDGKKVPRKASALSDVQEIPFYGWIVRALADGKVIGLKTSAPELEVTARDDDLLKKMRDASTQER